MGALEIKGKQQRRKNLLRNAIIGSVQAAGLLGVALVAPNAIQYLVREDMLITPRQPDLIRRAFRRLVTQGLIKVVDGKAQLTKAGMQAYEHITLMQAIRAPRKSARWDGRWRVLVFDLPERRRGTRDRFRQVLKLIGFVQMQQSVWVYPYDCEELISLIKTEAKVGSAVIYMIVDVLENDAKLRTHFHLRKE